MGSNLAARLLHPPETNQIIGLSRNSQQVYGPDSPANIRMLQGDILQPETYTAALSKCDTLYHCAALISFRKRDLDQVCRINAEGTGVLLEAAFSTGIKKVVHVSAGAVLGYSRDKNTILDETSDPSIDKNNVYAYSKQLAEAEVQKYVKKGLDVSIANPVTVYGPGDTRMNSGTIIKSVYERSMGASPPGGTSYVSAWDLAEGLLLLAKKGVPGERYIFCTENLSYQDLSRRIAEVLGVKPPRATLPVISYLPALGALKIKEMLSRSNSNNQDLMTAQILKEVYAYKYFSSDKARNNLGWEPRVLLEEAVQEAWDYYLSHNLIQAPNYSQEKTS